MSDAPCSTVATALLFGSIIFATTTLAARLWLTGLWTWKHGGQPLGAFHNGALDVSSLPSIYNLLHHSCIFGFILLYTYICENHPPFMHEEKTLYDRDEFLFCLVILAVVGVRSWRRNTTNGNKNAPAEANQQSYEEIDSKKVRRQYPDEGDPQTHKHNPQVAPRPSAEDEVLNRDQTEEWKGWMQFVFLLYHYMHAIEVYNGIRVLITCYVWLTGFGNFSFFYKTNDYSLPRLLQMLWRLNFLVIFLCLTHGNSYILYYICPLHTFYFLMVYAVMYIGKERNDKTWWIRCKLGLLGLIIFVVWDNSNNNNFGVFQGMQHFLILSDEPMAGAPYGTMWEWYFRSFLDHWSALLGMVFALNLPVMSLFFRKLEARSFGRQWIGKLSVLAGMLYAFISWVNGPFMMAKEEYNTTNPYFGFVPLLLYVYIRNLTPTLRSHSMSLLKEIGQTTLETYAMQHHVWLTSNSKTLLVFLPKYPRLNMILVTLSFVFISRRVYKLTIVLRNILLPNDRQTCIRSMSAMAVVVSGFYFTAFVLCRMQLVSMISIALLSILCGGLLYQTVMDSTWFDYHSTVKKSKEDEDDDEVKTFADKSELSFSIAGSDDESIVAKLCPPMIGILFLIVLGSVWNVIVAAGASSVGSLPPECAAYANEGSWIRVNTCNESNRAMAYRDHNVASFGTCSPQGTARIWVWKEQSSHPHCRFGQRGESKLRRMLDGRNLLFIGDSMTRNLYNASLRAMGVQDAGAYDATIPKHTDLHHVMWHSTLVNFKWAPLAVDQLNSLKQINNLAEHKTDNNDTPDLIAMGGGAWDKLHVYSTDENRKSHADTLKALSAEMKKSQDLGISVVWIIPTTINSQALNTEEKRDHMREEDMEAMRAVYSLNGILSSASFVIDGPAFTASRVSESFDGVHYPHQVYDGGAQILFQSLDWLLPDPLDPFTVSPKEVGTMSNASFGILLLALLSIGLATFDGFLGFSYLACLFVKGVRPCDLSADATSEDWKKRKEDGVALCTRNSNFTKSEHFPARKSGDRSVDDEIAALLR